MKRLVLHSDQVNGKTQIDEAFLKFFGDRKPTIAYIPSQSDLPRKYFNRKVEWYKQFGITDLLYFDIDQEYNKEKNPELLSCDAIFLSGGNTYYFLNSLRHRNFIPVLKGFVEKGGILIGVSAGSIIMSKTIAVTSIDDDIGGDQNSVGLKDFSALGLNNFDFFPHFDINNDEIVKRLKDYSKTSKSVIYACKDGDGIIIDGENMQFFGDVLKIEDGEITTA
ncbi:MAG: Type 1 glutamine amidotransferase-like domain-containing protein [Patescibacteria group bacterium]|jgi:dipeptidase E